jgi:hypothetical protein
MWGGGILPTQAPSLEKLYTFQNPRGKWVFDNFELEFFISFFSSAMATFFHQDSQQRERNIIQPSNMHLGSAFRGG